jgi:hypothetical protein
MEVEMVATLKSREVRRISRERDRGGEILGEVFSFSREQAEFPFFFESDQVRSRRLVFFSP